jgi:linearmycin/streptolysin S transport system permease protein
MRTNLAAALVIGRRILRQRIRDRSALLFAVVTPLGLALAFSLLVPNDFQTFHTRFVIVDLDGGPSATHLVDDAFGAIAAAGVAEVEQVATEAEARAILDAGNAGAVVIIPAGFSQAIASGAPTTVQLLGGEFPASFEVARSIVARFAAETGGAELLAATALDIGGPALVPQAVAMLSAPPPVQVVEAVPPSRQAGHATFYAAAMAIMFVFFATQYGALAIHADRQNGTLARHLAAPVTAGGILLGATLASLVLGLVAMTVLVIGSTVLAHATWGSPLLVTLLLFAGVVAASGISMLVSTIAHTPQQAGILNSIVALSLAAIGGVFLPLSQAPQTVVILSQVTPHAWFLRAIDTLSDPAAGVADIFPSLAVLLAMGVVTGGIGLARARRAMAI